MHMTVTERQLQRCCVSSRATCLFHSFYSLTSKKTSALLDLCGVKHRWNRFPLTYPVMRKGFPCHDIFMILCAIPSTGDLGWGLLSQFPPFRYFPNFSSLSKHTLTVKYRIYIWQVSPQLSCGDTCQIWMWFEESNMYFCESENFAYGEINERSFSNTPAWLIPAVYWYCVHPKSPLRDTLLQV